MSGFRCVSITLEARMKAILPLRGFCQTSKLQKAFPFANEQRMHVSVCVFFLSLLCATFCEQPFPFSVLHTPNHLQLNSECRHANQVLIHLKLTGRPDYGGGFRLQTPYRYHLYGNTCRDMKELPGSISQSIVCQLCQQTEGKLSHTHLNPTV